MDNHGSVIDGRTPENVIVCSSDEESIIRSIPRDDTSDWEEGFRQYNMSIRQSSSQNQYNTGIQLCSMERHRAYIGLPSMQRPWQITNFTLGVSLNRFCNTNGLHYIPE